MDARPLTTSSTAAARRIARTRTEPVSGLGPLDRDVMFALMERYYEDVTRAQFDADLAGKQHVIRMFDAAGGLCGFSTIQLLPFVHEGREVLAVFSGDTVIDRACWGQKQLQRAFSAFLLRLRLTRRGPLYWFLISKGFKTYLLMRHNLRCYPNHAEPTPPAAQALLDHVARLKYPDHYDAQRGVISFPLPAGAVRSDYAQVSAADLEDPDIRFFVARNPGYARGDELCCLAEISLLPVCWALLRYALLAPLRGLRRSSARPEPVGGARSDRGRGPPAALTQPPAERTKDV